MPSTIAERWGVPCLIAAALGSGCNKISEQEMLPWFKVRQSTSPKIGGLADPVTTTTYYVRRAGSWRQIDDEGVGGATVLNDRTVAYYDNGQARLIREGDAEAAFVCGPGLHGATFPRGAAAVDCVTVVDGPASAVATTVRFRRISAAGSVLNDKTIAADGPGRVFLQPMVTFYDDTATPYLVTHSEDFRAPPNCTIVAVRTDELEVWPGLPAMQTRDCSESKSWSPIVGRPLGRPNE